MRRHDACPTPEFVMSKIVRKPRTAALRRTRCNRAALAALGLWAASVASVQAAPAGTTLPANTLPVLRGVVSDYSNSATFSTATNAGSVGQTLTINQLLPKIILDWKNFDIGNGSVVQFIQPSSTSAVLNRIYSLDPTIIQGSIKANGQVYLVNQNGILFDRGAQVNVNTLVASSLNIDDKVFKSSVTTGGLFTPAFTGGYDATGATAAGSKNGSVVVGANGPAGAAAPSINAGVGGAIVIIAPMIDNQSGVITSPDGQVILAAGTSAYLGFSATDNTGFRGMLVQVTADGAPLNLSTVINSGSISADRGNVTLAGLAINQSGRVSASTAMLTKGSIYLQANTLNDAHRGTVTLGVGSITETPLDLNDKTTLSQVTKFDPYRPVVHVDGATIDVEGRIISPSGLVTLDAKGPVTPANARVYLGAASSVDASGAWSTASDAKNLLTFKVTSTELKNAPDQQGGLLLGATVTVDLRNPSSVLDLSGYRDIQQRTLAQKAAAGGIVAITSTGSVVQHAGSTIDVAGGGVHYTGATESTTKLLGADGKLYDIGSAPEALKYAAIASSFTQKQSRWGYSQTFSNLLMGASIKRPDFTEGVDGGALKVALSGGTNGLVLDGTLLGGTTTGSQQTAAAPRAGSLVIGNFDSTKTSQDFGIGDLTFATGSQSSLAAGFGFSTALDDAARKRLSLSADVLSAGIVSATGDVVTTGFGDVEVNANGRVTVPQNVTLTGPVGSSLTLRANQVEIDGHVDLAAGSVTVQAAKTPLTAGAASSIVVAQGATIDTSGTWVNNSSGVASTLPTGFLDATGNTVVARNGGSITLAAPVVDFQTGSSLDVSAGGTDSARGVFAGGNGGAISLTATQAQSTSPLILDGTLAGYGFANGGSLALSSQNAVTIVGGSSGAKASDLTLGTPFFQEGGFASFSVASNSALSVKADSVVAPTQTNLQVDPALAATLPSGSNITSAARFLRLPDNQRAPTQLTLSSAGTLTLQANAAINAEAGAKVNLSGVSGVAIDGLVQAPGGAINIALTGTVPSSANSTSALPTLEIGQAAIIATRGTFVATPNDKQLVQGTLSAGGSVTLQARQATIALDAGSVIDVSGAIQVVDVPSAAGAAAPYQQVRQSSNAGTVSIVANDAVALNGAIRGNASGSAAGGSFSLTLNERGDIADPLTGRRIVVSQSGAARLATDSNFKEVSVSANKLAGAGFDKLSLTAEDQIVFSDDATLHFQRGVTLDSKVLHVANGAKVIVSGSEVALENLYGERTRANPDAAGDFSTLSNAAAPSLVRATAAGTGSFTAMADTLDVLGSVTVNGARSTSLTATDDLRLSGRSIGDKTSVAGATLVGGLLTGGDLTLTAAQVYPTTGSTITVGVGMANADGSGNIATPGGQLRIEHGTGPTGDVFSAGGHLTLNADDLVQNGVVKAPLGTLNLDAGSTLTLGATSITSVSANALAIPYGETQNGVTWTYGALANNPTTSALTAPPAKNIGLAAPAIDVLSGATVDISGGGDVAAIEYIPSSSSSKNALTQPNTYAIIPAAKLAAAPIDPDIAASSGAGFNQPASVYDSIRIGAGGAVPAGTYVLLPATYALLKGGYLVQLLTGTAYNNLQVGQTATLQNGQTVVPGVMTASGTSVASSTTLGVVVQPNTVIPKLGDYTVTTSAYFATLSDASRTAVPPLPTDGGQLSIAAAQRLTLDGTLLATLPTAASRSAGVDIAANQIALVDQVGRGDIPAGYLQIDSGSLSKLDASLLIGGVRTTTATGELVTPTASDIIVANSSINELKAPELVLAATNSIDVRSGSVIEGSGGAAVKASAITIGGATASSGAVLRVSNAGLVDIDRPATDASRGTIGIASGATVIAAGSVALDATRTTTSQGMLQIASGGALSLVSGSLTLGDTDALPQATTGLVLDNAQLAAFNTLGTLSLKSYGAIDLVGNAQVGSSQLANLVIDAASLTGQAAADGSAASAHIGAGKLTFLNSASGTPLAGAAGPGAGALVLDASQITLGAGNKSVSGFGDLQLHASGEILGSGSGTLTTASSLEASAARIGSVGGANQVWSAQDGSGPGAPQYAVNLSTVATLAPLADSTAIGSRLQITGSSITDSANIVMHGGGVTLQAQGPATTDGVVLASGAIIDASGATKNFQGTFATADAGQVTLASAQGMVQIASGSTVDVSAATAGGNAGSLTLSGASLQVAGTLKGGSAAGTAGNISVDVQTLSDFSGLNATLAQAGFAGDYAVRVRNGNLTVAAGDVVKAATVDLESDAGDQSGTVTIAGRLSASSSGGGGTIEVDGRDVNVTAGALIDARASASVVAGVTSVSTYSNGGSVVLDAAGGALGFASGATIDVTGGAQGSAGSVLLRAPRRADSLQASLGGTVLSTSAGGARAQVIVEGNRVYGPKDTGTSIDRTKMDGYAADNLAWMGAVDANALSAGILGDGGAAQGNVQVRPAVEVRAAGDLAIVQDWNLTGSGWRFPSSGGTLQAGTLLVRAAGNLALSSASIGNPDSGLQAGATWNIGLVGGSDLTAANGFRTQSTAQLTTQAAGGHAGAGDLTLDSQSAEASVRTGTGAIHLAAGRDFVIATSAGSTDVNGDPLIGVVMTTGAAAITDKAAGAPSQARFAQAGGDITISAQRDASGSGNEWMTEWYRSPSQGSDSFSDGVWWSYRANFHDGVATMGGGNISISAGRDVDDLSAYAPTSAIQTGSGATAALATYGGGNVAVRAANDIVGGQYLVSLGSGSIVAGGDVGGQGQASQVFMMGLSGNPALSGATVAVKAGNAISLNTIDNPSSLASPLTFGTGPSFGNGLPLPVLSGSADSAVSLAAGGGDIRIGNRPADSLTLDPNQQSTVDAFVTSDTNAAILPPKVDFTAFNGNIVYTGLYTPSTPKPGLTTFPSVDGSVRILAAAGVSHLNIDVSDADPTQFAIRNYPTTAVPNFSELLSNTTGTPGRLVTNSSTAPWIDDVVALGGNAQGVTFTFPVRSRIWAAGDISNPVLDLQNLNAGDLSEVVANQGAIRVAGASTNIGGPGTLLLQAGQDISLGTNPLASIGNTLNQNIADPAGANIVVIAGTAGAVDTTKLDTTFAALIQAGTARKPADATTAVDALFKGATIGTGNIDSFGTSIESHAGGTINLLAPGGDITVGLPAPSVKLIGVISDFGGAIRSYLSGNFNINQGKVLTAQGGDILIYTSTGGIDAGRGAHTSVTTPPPTRTPLTDKDGNFIGYTYSIPVAVAGSGIQTATSKPAGPDSVAPPAGNIYLFAPQGTIDAGEAGIASGGAIFIAALTVLNADNISSVGPSSGVPQVVAGSVASTVAASGAATAANVTPGADAAAQASAAAAAAGVTNFKPAILTVEVLGFGEKNCKETDKDCFAK
jgi:filamentous hemagglutinin